MKSIVQHKVESLKAKSGAKTAKHIVMRTSSIRSNQDNLSKSIRTKEEAEDFRRVLKIALEQAK